MKTEQLINDLGLTMGLQGLTMNEDGCARLVFDDKLAVNFEHDPETGELVIYMTLSLIPAEDREAFFLSLLEGNFARTQTAGFTLAVDSNNDEVILCQSILNEELGTASFVRIIENFINIGEQWHTNIKFAMASVKAKPDSVQFDIADQRNAFVRG